ncbi:MAG TPA: hypothetical protein PLL92_08075, partial [Alicycliphilus sp.]|nr:hypothetical protein [Alicycliphilus sp.]
VNQSANTIGVFWTFFDQDSNHVTDGCFPMTAKDYEPFSWSSASGLGLENKRGYLVFAVGTNDGTTTAANACGASHAVLATSGAALAAAAFQVELASKDVAFTPVIDGPLTLNPAGANLSSLGPDSLTGVAGAAPTNAQFSMRYFLDGGANTRIAVWSVGNQKGTHTVNIYDDKQNRKSVNFALTHTELDWFDPAVIPGRPANFTDGFIEWQVGVPGDFVGSTSGALANQGTNGAFVYSVIDAPAFGAIQSILGFHQLGGGSGGGGGGGG